MLRERDHPPATRKTANPTVGREPCFAGNMKKRGFGHLFEV